MNKQNWIYQTRGLAVIAVVVCHQQWILHKSEVIQLLSLYSVTTLIFLMGVTKAFSLKSHYCENPRHMKILTYSINSMLPTLYSYIAASFFYSYRQLGGADLNAILSNILSFSASSPFYFIRYYILLSLWAPLLFTIIKLILMKPAPKLQKAATMIIAFVFIWLTGYCSIGKMEIFGQSYLFVYSAGLLAGAIKLPTAKKFYLLPASLLLLSGLISTKRFYWARLNGIYDYAEGIDFLSPKLQMNPPNISIIIYSFGVITVAYLCFELIKQSNIKCIKLFENLFIVIGKYSLDIFLWHLYIQEFLNRYFLELNNMLFKRIIYYSSMIFIPVIIRYLYNRMKEKIYTVLVISDCNSNK